MLIWEITGDGFSEILIVYWYSVIQSPCQWQLSLFIAIVPAMYMINADIPIMKVIGIFVYSYLVSANTFTYYLIISLLYNVFLL